MLYYNTVQLLTENIHDIFLNALENKKLSSKKIGKSFYFWTSKDCFTRLREKGFSLFSIKDFKVKV
jgi:hypothetical protein